MFNNLIPALQDCVPEKQKRRHSHWSWNLLVSQDDRKCQLQLHGTIRVSHQHSVCCWFYRETVSHYIRASWPSACGNSPSSASRVSLTMPHTHGYSLTVKTLIATVLLPPPRPSGPARCSACRYLHLAHCLVAQVAHPVSFLVSGSTRTMPCWLS